MILIFVKLNGSQYRDYMKVQTVHKSEQHSAEQGISQRREQEIDEKICARGTVGQQHHHNILINLKGS